MPDEYESDEIPADRVEDLLRVVQRFRRRRAFGERVTDVLDRFEAAMAKAIARKQPVWFML